MRQKWSLIVMVIVLLQCFLLESCISNDQQDDLRVGLSVLTDKSLYHNERIYIHISNKTESILYLLLYNSAFREKIVKDRWSLVTSSLIDDPQSDTVIININETTVLDIFVVKPGIYRVGIPFLWDGDPGRKDTVYSNEFEVY